MREFLSNTELLLIALSVLAIVLFIIAAAIARASASARARRQNRELLEGIDKVQEQRKKAEGKPPVLSMAAGLEREGEEAPAQTKPQEAARAKYDETIETLITNHHEQALREARTQFWFSLIAACVGFVFIALTFFSTKDAEWLSKLVTMIPGVIIEAVSALFFSQSKETRERSSDFLNRLREDRKFEKGVEIANTIQDKDLKAKMLASIALNLCGIGVSVLQDPAKPAAAPVEEQQK